MTPSRASAVGCRFAFAGGIDPLFELLQDELPSARRSFATASAVV